MAVHVIPADEADQHAGDDCPCGVRIEPDPDREGRELHVHQALVEEPSET